MELPHWLMVVGALFLVLPQDNRLCLFRVNNRRNGLPHVRYSPGSGRIADIVERQFRANVRHAVATT
jgi:hypothetical protein